MTPKTPFASRLAGGLLAFGIIAAMLVLVALNAAGTPPLVLTQGLPALNTGGDEVYAEMYINDGTGVVTTPNDAGVYTVVGGAAPLVLGESDGSACITASITTGLFTVAARCGVGDLELTACLPDVAGSSNAAEVTTGRWQRTRAGTTAAVTGAPTLRKAEAVDAGNARNDFGCSVKVVDADLADTYGFYVTNPGGGLTLTTRSANLRVRKLVNK